MLASHKGGGEPATRHHDCNQSARRSCKGGGTPSRAGSSSLQPIWRSQARPREAVLLVGWMVTGERRGGGQIRSTARCADGCGGRVARMGTKSGVGYDRIDAILSFGLGLGVAASLEI
jgi:hypothetical protein